MLRSIKRPREEISANAPRLIQIQINPEKIGLVIGPGGKTIRRLQDETGAKIDIEDSGIVTLSSLDAAGAEAARDKIQAMTEGVQVGRIYEGRVTSIKDFGAFVEILPGKDGLVHISELSDGYVSSVTDICRVGDPMLVKAIAVDDQDRVKLSRKAALAERGEPDDLRRGPTPPAERPPGGGPRRRRPLPAAAARRPRRAATRRWRTATAATAAVTETVTAAACHAGRAPVTRQARLAPDERQTQAGDGDLVPAGPCRTVGSSDLGLSIHAHGDPRQVRSPMLARRPRRRQTPVPSAEALGAGAPATRAGTRS